LRYRFKIIWCRFWMRFAVLPAIGRIATRLALVPLGPFRDRYPLAAYYPHGFTAPDVALRNKDLVRGRHVYIGSRVTIYRARDGGRIHLEDEVFLNDGIRLETALGGRIRIGAGTHIQPECQLSAYVGEIRIGKRVQIAPRCAFYPYNHSMNAEQSIMAQPLVSKGYIEVQDEAWLGYGVIVLDGVIIGKGAVVGAGSVVKHDIPSGAICAGVPARVIGQRR
jgi:acetyltransferase-like isoleucine patch superfamily enzyme